MKRRLAALLCALGLHRWQPARRYFAGVAHCTIKTCARCGAQKFKS